MSMYLYKSIAHYVYVYTLVLFYGLVMVFCMWCSMWQLETNTLISFVHVSDLLIEWFLFVHFIMLREIHFIDIV